MCCMLRKLPLPHLPPLLQLLCKTVTVFASSRPRQRNRVFQLPVAQPSLPHCNCPHPLPSPTPPEAAITVRASRPLWFIQVRVRSRSL
jgi:hypothetical protein